MGTHMITVFFFRIIALLDDYLLVWTKYFNVVAFKYQTEDTDFVFDQYKN